MKLMAESNELQLYRDGDRWILKDRQGKVVEEGVGNAFADYIDRRWGGVLVNVRNRKTDN
jgi:hypothetical protein